ncbi:hypothetical protein [uncultured Tateyamaria sp.]|uniref:aspartate racemase/maleate isomerase family protein n=1 Tax=uncultured Tateyamaria sp. TaxID=455651 RepID=UPI00260AEB8A|nr:hypothetical protein [uncultured Tateyamaria sp.]
MQVAARSLGRTGCKAVVLSGTPFTWAHDPTEADARALQARLSRAAGHIPFVFPGLAIVDACRSLGIKRPACCTTYYPADWRDGWAGFLRDCGLGPNVVLSMDQLDMVPAINAVSEQGWTLSADDIVASARAVRQADPDADGMLITGAGANTYGLINDMEREFGIPVIGADGAILWGLARAMEVELADGCLGQVTNVPMPSPSA